MEFKAVYQLKGCVSKPKGSNVAVYRCEHSATKQRRGVKLISASHMDFDEPALVGEIQRLKRTAELGMEGVAQFVALYRSDSPDEYQLVFTCAPLCLFLRRVWQPVRLTRKLALSQTRGGWSRCST